MILFFSFGYYGWLHVDTYFPRFLGYLFEEWLQGIIFACVPDEVAGISVKIVTRAESHAIYHGKRRTH